MEPATGALTLGDDGILPISEGVHCPVHAAVRQIRLGTVMLKSDEESSFRPNKAGLWQRFVYAEPILKWNQGVYLHIFLVHRPC